jgi:hypothetical protein
MVFIADESNRKIRESNMHGFLALSKAIVAGAYL